MQAPNTRELEAKEAEMKAAAEMGYPEARHPTRLATFKECAIDAQHELRELKKDIKEMKTKLQDHFDDIVDFLKGLQESAKTLTTAGRTPQESTFLFCKDMIDALKEINQNNARSSSSDSEDSGSWLDAPAVY